MMVTKLYRCQLFLEHTRSKTRKAVPFISKFRVSGAVARYGLTSVHTEEVPQEARHAMRRASWRAPARNAKNRRSSRRGQSGGNAHRHYAILADHDVIGISLDLDRPADGARDDRVFVVVETARDRSSEPRFVSRGNRQMAQRSARAAAVPRR